MNESSNTPEPRPNDTRPEGESPRPVVDRPAQTPSAASLDQWLKRAAEATNEMATDEKLRKEVARRLT